MHCTTQYYIQSDSKSIRSKAKNCGLIPLHDGVDPGLLDLSPEWAEDCETEDERPQDILQLLVVIQTTQQIWSA